MIRAAAKNHDDVAVVVEAQDYQAVLDELAANKGATTLALRRRLAAKAYARTAAYDAAISNWFALQLKNDAPDFRAFGGRLIQSLRYGENPHQTAAFYARPTSVPASPPRGSCRARNCPTTTSTIPMRPMNASASSTRSAPRPASSSSTPTPAASPKDPIWSAPIARRSPATRPSPYGGIIAVNRTLDAEAARVITEILTEVIIAPDATEEAIAIIATRKNLRLLLAGGLPDPRAAGLTAKTVAGGLLVQSRDNAVVDDMTLKMVTKRAPTDAELRDLKFAFRVAKHVKSNTIIYAKDLATVGIGAGQMSRVDSARIAARKALGCRGRAKLAEPLTKGSVVASDAFFPFADGMLACIEAGATAVIQPGGSIRDEEVIKAADEHGIAMVFTGVRHFRH